MNKLVVAIDLQNDFIDGSLGTKEAQAIIPTVCETLDSYIKDKDVHRIIFTMDTHFNKHEYPYSHPEYLNTLEGVKLPIEHCIAGTKGIQINKDVCDVIYNNAENIQNSKIIIEHINKSTFSCNWYKYGSDNCCYYDFDSTNFDSKCASANCEIIIFGLCTDICVISNALAMRSAFPNIPIKCIAKCCAGTTPENHKSALDIMKSCQIDIIE